MKNLIAFLSSQRDGGLLLLRVFTGILFIGAGWGKFNGDWAIGFFTKVGIPIPSVAGPFVTVLELGGGAALILGLLTRYLGILFAIELTVATYVQWIVFNKGFAGARLELLLVFIGILLATHGAGKISLDRMLKLER